MESDPRTNRELPTNYFYFSIRNGIKVFKEQKTRDGGGSLLILKRKLQKLCLTETREEAYGDPTPQNVNFLD